MHNEDCWTHISRNTIIIHCIKQTLQELIVNLWCCFKASNIFCLILVADDLASYYIRKHLFIKEPNLSFIHPYFLLLMKSVFSKTISSTTFLDLVRNKSNYFIFILYLFLFFQAEQNTQSHFKPFITFPVHCEPSQLIDSTFKHPEYFHYNSIYFSSLNYYMHVFPYSFLLLHLQQKDTA